MNWNKYRKRQRFNHQSREHQLRVDKHRRRITKYEIINQALATLGMPRGGRLSDPEENKMEVGLITREYSTLQETRWINQYKNFSRAREFVLKLPGITLTNWEHWLEEHGLRDEVIDH